MSTFLNTTGLAGRLLLSAPFVIAGSQKLLGADASAAYMATAGLPASSTLALAVGTFEIVAGIALASGFRTRVAALALAVFTVLATALFHAYWKSPADLASVQELFFIKNVAMVGGLLLAAATQGGAWSIDTLRRDRSDPQHRLSLG